MGQWSYHGEWEVIAMGQQKYTTGLRSQYCSSVNGTVVCYLEYYQTSQNFFQRLSEETDKLESQSLAVDIGNRYVISVLVPSLGSLYKGTTRDQTYLGKLVMTYQLLDTLLWAAEWPDHPRLKFIPQSENLSAEAHIQRLLNYLQDWTRIIPKTVTLSSLAQTSEESLATAESRLITLSPNLTIPDLEKNIVQQATLNMLRMVRHNTSSSTHNILDKWYSLAFSITAFRPVSSKVI
jgi:hypothetical protein